MFIFIFLFSNLHNHHLITPLHKIFYYIYIKIKYTYIFKDYYVIGKIIIQFHLLAMQPSTIMVDNLKYSKNIHILKIFIYIHICVYIGTIL